MRNVMSAGSTFAVIAAACLALGASQNRDAELRANAAVPAITVGANVHVSLARANVAHGEVMSCTDPNDPNRMVVGSMAFPDGNVTTLVYGSLDGGNSWSLAFDTAKDMPDAGDPTCAYDETGTVYYAAVSAAIMWRGPGGASHRLYLYRSKDGRNWDAPIVHPNIDRPFLAIDHTSGPYRGYLYYSGQGSALSLDAAGEAGGATPDAFQSGLMVYASDDRGRHVLGPRGRLAFGMNYVDGAGNTVILSDGTLVSVFGAKKNRLASRYDPASKLSLRSIRTAPGGIDQEPAVTVGDWRVAPESGSHLAFVAVDPGSALFKDRLYTVRIDSASGRAAVLLSRSADGGRTWSEPVIVDDDRSRGDAQQAPNSTNPSIAVNRDGVVAVGWMDRREHADNRGWSYRVAVSMDGGQTFSPSVRVSSAPAIFDDREAWPTNSGSSATAGGSRLRSMVSVYGFWRSGGHTVSMTADANGLFHPVWVDNRTGTPQVWTASVRVTGPIVRGTATEFAGLEDVTRAMAFEIVTSHFDRATGTGTLNVRLRNVSGHSLTGPFKVRVASVASELGTPAFRSMENSRPAVGAVWTFLVPSERAILAAGETTTPRLLVFTLADLKPIQQGERNRYGLLNMETTVWAPPRNGLPPVNPIPR
jgi:hypothetical protein